MIAAWMLWATSIAGAAEADCVPYPPARAAEDVSQFIAMAQFDKIQERVQRMEQGFVCLSSFSTTDALAKVYQVAGTAAFHSEDLSLAAARYERAVLVAPVVPFDVGNLGAAPLSIFETARTTVLDRPTGMVVAEGPVVLNGASLRTGATLPVATGSYLVQHVGVGQQYARVTAQRGPIGLRRVAVVRRDEGAEERGGARIA